MNGDPLLSVQEPAMPPQYLWRRGTEFLQQGTAMRARLARPVEDFVVRPAELVLLEQDAGPRPSNGGRHSADDTVIPGRRNYPTELCRCFVANTEMWAGPGSMSTRDARPSVKNVLSCNGS